MRVHHLFEVHVPTDFQLLVDLWDHRALGEVLAALQHLKGDDSAQLLLSIFLNAKKKYQHSQPERIYDTINAFTKVELADEWGYGPSSSFTRFLGFLIAVTKKIGPEAVELMVSKLNIDALQKAGFISTEEAGELKIALNKKNRTKAERRHDADTDLFVFIARPAFKEVPEGSGNFKKTLEIERLVKIDKYDISHLKAVSMMQLRARVQGEGSEVYRIDLPAGSIDQEEMDNPPDWLIHTIDQHKKKLK